VNCPICHKEVEDVRQAHTTEPFVMPATEIAEGLDTWGAYAAEKTTLCQDERFVHFRFDGDGHERLVEMVGERDYDEVAEKQAYWDSHPQQCQHEGCSEQGRACYVDQYNPAPDEWFCWDHCHEHGYCPSCGLFNAGIDSFDFGASGLCEWCADQLDDDNDYEDEYEGDDWDYDSF